MRIIEGAIERALLARQQSSGGLFFILSIRSISMLAKIATGRNGWQHVRRHQLEDPEGDGSRLHNGGASDSPNLDKPW